MLGKHNLLGRGNKIVFTDAVKHYFRRILISQLSCVENRLHFNLVDFPVNFIMHFVFCFFWCLPNFIIKIPIVLLFKLHITKNIAYHVMEVLIFYADKLMLLGNSKNLCVFNFAILLKL